MSSKRKLLDTQLLPFYFICLALLLLQQRDFTEALENPLSLWNLNKLVGIALGGGLALLTLITSPPQKRSLTFSFLLGSYIGISAFSLVSHTPFSLAGWWKITELISIFLVFTYICRDVIYNPGSGRNYYLLCMIFIKFLIATAIFGLIISPQEALSPVITEASIEKYGETLLTNQLHGVIIKINSNSLGLMAGIVALHSLVNINSKKLVAQNIIWLVIAAAVFILSQSRTAFIATAFGVLIYLLVSPKQRVRNILIAGFSTISMTLAYSSTIWSYLSRGMDVERLTGLTGRMEWWSVALTEYNSQDLFSKIFGMGFYTANRNILSNHLGHDGAANLHSEYVDTIVSNGIIGIVLVIIIILYSLRQVLSYHIKKNSQLSPEYLAVLLMLAVRSITGTTFFSFGLFMLLFLSIIAMTQPSKSHINI